jgi:very-short-patch-repair endonuclease
VEINDLYDESPLEDRLWAELKRHKIPAERQEFLTVQEENYALDFAIYCDQANIDVETDGDTWHANPEKAAADNLRDNALEAAGWKVLRFSTPQIHEGAASYCIPTIRQTINKLGGVEEGKLVARRIDPDVEGAVQLGLFDDW